MAFGSLLRRSIQLSAITIICLVIFVVSYALLLPAPPNDANQSGGESMLIIVTALNVAVMGWLILRAYEQGIRLAAPLALAFYMVQTFMPQLEALIFPAFAQHLPPGMLGGMLLAGLVHSLLWIPLAVLILGKWPRTSETRLARETSPRIQGWVWRLPLAIIAYVMVYFVFGYYIAWRNPAVAAYYGGSDPGSFLAQLQSVWADNPGLFGAQAVRGLLWTLIALLVIRIMRRTRGEMMLVLGLLFAVVMNAGLLLPNPYMPPDVRMTHLLETASSNLLCGALLGILFTPATRHEHVTQLELRQTNI